MSQEQNSVLEYRVASLEAVVREVKDAVKSIDTSLQTLARLEARHSETRESLSRAFTDIEDHEKRIRILEADMPTVRMIRNWVIGGMTSCVGLVGIAVVHQVMK